MDMPSLSTSVDFTSLGEVIPFCTYSDALLAKFIHKYDSVDVKLLNDLIAMLRTPKFNSTDVTFDNVAGIHNHIAEQRQVSHHQRAFERTCLIISFPQVVVGVIAECLAQESPSIFAEYIEQAPSYKALLSMTLVHRSWTEAAQRVLRRRLVVRGPDKLYELRHNLELGPWVREFSYKAWTLKPTIDMSSHRFATIFVEILRACPNIRDLRFETYFHIDAKTSALDKVINELPHLPSLERLCLKNYQSKDGLPDLRLFLQVLPRLTTLKSLTLVDWADRSSHLNPSEQGSLDEIGLPGPALTSLSYKAYGITHRHLLSLIFRPAWLTSLEICNPIFFKELISELEIQAVYTVLSRITTFRFHVECDPEQTCFDPLMKCIKLRHLTIVVLSVELIKPILTIPDTLEHLWVHYTDPLYFQSYVSRDGCTFILDSITRLPKLKTLTITNHGFRAFEEIPAYCSEKGIKLILLIRAELPPFE